jgi:hypothetical protein
MSAQKQSPTSRFLRYLKTKTEPGSTSNTIKKAAPGAQIGESVQHKPVVSSGKEDSDFPREYYRPRPVPKSFVVGEVRKVFSNVSPSDSNKAREQVVKTAAAQQESTADAKSAADPASNSERSRRSTARSDTPVELISGTAATRTSANTQPVSTGVNGEQYPQPTFDLLVGQQDSISQYFTRRYFSAPYVAAARDATKPPRDVLHHISELDSEAFEVYKMYTNTGKIGFKCPADVKPKYMWVACWPLMNAHIMGCIIEEPAFADRVMDTLAEKLPPGLAPDFKTVEHLFDGSRKGIPDVLKVFVADRFVNAQQRSHIILHVSIYPESFKEAALQSALRHLANSPHTAARPGCGYHTHRDKEACYKTKLTPVDTLKEQRLAAARENSTKDAEFVTANALQNGVKSVDWQQRRAAAKQGLRIDTGQAWTGFRSLEIGDHAVWNKSTSDHVNDVSDSVYDTNSKDHVPPANSTRHTYDPTRTPNNSPVLQNHPTKTHLITDAASNASTNGYTMASEPAGCPMVAPSQTSHAFLLAELDGNSVNATRPTVLAEKYGPSIDRMRASGTQAMTSSVATNVVGEHETDVDSLSNGVSASDRRVGELTTEYERCVSCPGAYPKSDVGV